jgi:hypothetical protein
MDAYKTPESNLELPQQRPFKPIKALVFGLLVSVGLMFLISTVLSIIFYLLNIDVIEKFADESEITLFVSRNIPYLISDLIASFAVLYFSGTIVRKYAVGYELKFAVILSLLTFAALLLFVGMDDTEEDFPMWYSVASFASIFVGIILGARAKT